MFRRLSSWWVVCSLVGSLFAQAVATPIGLASAGSNRAQLEKALKLGPVEQRAVMEWLLGNLPETDAKTLSAEFLLRQVSLACRARAQVPWGKTISDELFYNFVVPYVQASEAVEDWRSDFTNRYLPLVSLCATPGEAGRKLNETIFGQLKVHYSTKRRAADQAPSDSIAQGMATCTGLSILLADACRACCIPARIVTVKWATKEGNHTWVEIWDGSAWRFCGADEPDPNGLDRGWFVGEAAIAAAHKDPAFHIWAVSFAPTGHDFVAGYGPGITLHGIDVSAHYLPKQDPAPSGPAIAAANAADSAVEALFARYFAADAEAQARFEFDQNLDAEVATKVGDARLRRIAFAALLKSEHKELRADFAASRVRAFDKQSPYVLKQVGSKPLNGYPLVIAMHGGGGVPKEVNDSQWQHMQIYYKDHPETGGYLYCALRAPTDEWNGFYTDYMYPLIERLILQFVICAEVDPAKVYAIGYSHGGYGAFSIGPKMPHRFAAVHASAAAPNDAQTSAIGLHNLKFSFMVGDRDTAYGRRSRCEGFEQILQGLKKAHEGLYPTTFTLVANNGHTGLPDRDLLPQLLLARRDTLCTKLFWELTDSVIRDHYWLHTDTPAAFQRIDAVLSGQTLMISNVKIEQVEALLDANMVDCSKPLLLIDGDQQVERRLRPSVRVLCSTMQQRGDAELAATCIIKLR